MQIIQIYEPMAALADEVLRMRDALEGGGMSVFPRPQEDYKKISVTHPIFAVADGVTLEPDADGVYPSVSGAGEVARIVCEAIVQDAEAEYANFGKEKISLVFARANEAVGKYNEVSGHSAQTSNFWDHDLFAATCAFAVIKENTVWWASLCDAYILHLGANGEAVFRSPECWPRRSEFLPAGWDALPEGEKKKIIRQKYRNMTPENGVLKGYGVATGEKNACGYLNIGSFEIQPGERLLLFTDGFEEYAKLSEFLQLLQKWPKHIEKKIKEFTAKKAAQNPNMFGHERTLVAVAFE